MLVFDFRKFRALWRAPVCPKVEYKKWSVSQPGIESLSNCPHFGTLAKTGLMSGEVSARLRSTACGLLGVMSGGLGLGAVVRGRAADRSTKTGHKRRRLSVARRQHERRREAFPVDRIVGLEPHQQLTTTRYHLRRNLRHSRTGYMILSDFHMFHKSFPP